MKPENRRNCLEAIEKKYANKILYASVDQLYRDILNAVSGQKPATLLVLKSPDMKATIARALDQSADLFRVQIRAEALTAPFLTALSSALERLGRKDLALIAALKAHEYGEVAPREILRTSEMMRSFNLFTLNIYFLCRFTLLIGNAKKIIPNLAESLIEFGEIQLGLDLYKDYTAEFQIDVDKMKNLAAVAMKEKLYESAKYWATEALRRRPKDSYVRQILAISNRHLCDWSNRDVETKFLEETVASGIALSLFDSLSWVDNPYLHLAQSKRHQDTADYAPNRPALASQELQQGGRIKIGYFGADFHDHATMYLMSGLLREHDHENFEIFIFSYGPPSEQEMRRVAESCADSFFDVFGWKDEDIVSLAHEMGLDIAVDLKGYTTQTRAGIFKHRLAPVQVSYLGYPGTLGLEYMDYIIADRVVIPPVSAGDYEEKVIYLPDSYMPNDNQRKLAPLVMTRMQLGLPEYAFILCCFNASYKIGPDEFDIWMRVLGAIEGSVLWLFRSNSHAEENLKREAERRGIDRDRIFFAERLPHSEHLARIALADLFVDTFNYNAHTTASDALWAGLPIVSKSGRQFAARVGASLLTATGLPELITTSTEGYESLICNLAKDREKLKEIRSQLARKRLSERLFDTRQYTRNFESGLRQAYENYLRGEKPRNLWVKSAHQRLKPTMFFNDQFNSTYHNIIPYINRHSARQKLLVEKQSSEFIHRNEKNTHKNYVILSELAQHGSDAYGKFASFLSTKGDGERLISTRRIYGLVHAEASRVLKDSRFHISNKEEFELLHPVNAIFIDSQKLDRPVIVVFTTAYNNFYISNPVFATLLLNAGYSCLFLKDPTGFQYTKGIAGLGQDWRSSISKLRDIIKEVSRGRKIIFTGFSSSGFAAILAAVELEVSHVVGFSISASLSPESGLRMPKLITSSMYGNMPPEMRVDLKKVIKNSSTSISLYFGGANSNDRAGAYYLRGCGNVKVNELQDEGHICFRGLFVKGELISIFDDNS